MKAWEHLKTITYHKYLVMKGCFKVGLYYQGMMHDLSKYSPTEFLVGARYYQGDRSPNNAEREDIGFSSAWLHHKGRNKHHYEYWTDMKNGQYEPVRIPIRYVKESLCDRIAATKIYLKKSYTDTAALTYFDTKRDDLRMHKETATVLRIWLSWVRDIGIKKTLKKVKKIKTYEDMEVFL